MISEIAKKITGPFIRTAEHSQLSDEINSRRLSVERRQKGGMLAYYLAGGPEQRHISERRKDKKMKEEMTYEKRLSEDRRRRIDTKYLNCGKCIDRRFQGRRSMDRIDEEAVERERYLRLGPGWL